MNTTLKNILVSGAVITSFISLMGVATNASAAMTPQEVSPDGYGVRYENPKASFYNKSSSDRYRDIWRAARDNWNGTGAFTWTETSNVNSRTYTSSVSESTGQWVDATGMTTYRVHIDANNPAWQTGATILLNRYNLDKYNYTNTERAAVATHEMGHAIGLDHNSEATSIMNPAPREQHIVQDDINGVNHIYEGSALRSTDAESDTPTDVKNHLYSTQINYVKDYSNESGIQALKADSDMIVVGTVKDSQSHDDFSQDKENHYTTHKLDVSESLKGNTAESLSFYQSGTDKVDIVNSQLLKDGDRVMVVLHKDDDGNLHVMNDGQGIFVSNGTKTRTTETFTRVSDKHIVTMDMLK
ncbi:matrixin family metalloprotease [Secundilactobacillus hailunensis]|uniref:Matrixin family metalloprotease n=1 Tax=Secundilactobacillus hailunensis TaxID=2559923 RepID=A0ABW1TAA7_9LACO|nr:matrixin family metalloprotease [Secundilactobacillus hailunensis]